MLREGAALIAEVVEKSNYLQTLLINNQCIEAQGGVALAKAAENNRCLTRLDIGQPGYTGQSPSVQAKERFRGSNSATREMGEVGTLAFAEMLQKNTCLGEVGFAHQMKAQTATRAAGVTKVCNAVVKALTENPHALNRPGASKALRANGNGLGECSTEVKTLFKDGGRGGSVWVS